MMGKKKDSFAGMSLEDRKELTPQQLIRNMRKVVAPAGQRGSWMRRLSDDQLADVFHRLKMGQSCYKIAKIAQEDWGIRKNASPKSLSRAVRDFKEKMLGELELEATDEESKLLREEGRKLLERGRSSVAKLDGLDRLRWLIEVQTERVISMLESKLAWYDQKTINKAISTLQNMLDKYLRLQIDLGVLEAKPQELQLTLKHRFEGLLQHTVSPGTALKDWADKFLEKAESEALTFSLDDDGEYKLIGPGDRKDAGTKDPANDKSAGTGDNDSEAA